MAYCGPRGLPHSEFLGRVPGPGEPRWLPSDRAKALDWQAYEAGRCRGCGLHPDDIKAGSFHAHLTQCPGCQHRERAADTREAQEGRGVSAVALPVAAPDCPRCARFDD